MKGDKIQATAEVVLDCPADLTYATLLEDELKKAMEDFPGTQRKARTRHFTPWLHSR
jgi:hypothetical protein